MNENEVKQVVKDTVNELLCNDMLKYSDHIIYDQISKRLRDYYKSGIDPVLRDALSQLMSHQYYKVLFLYYGDGLTLEQLAERYDVDMSTIVRNKKYLCIKLFNLIK